MCWPALLALVFQMRVVLPSLLGNQGKQEHLGSFLFHLLQLPAREHGDFPTSSFGNESGHSSFWGTVMSPRDICAPGKRELQLPFLWQRLQGPACGRLQGWLGKLRGWLQPRLAAGSFPYNSSLFALSSGLGGSQGQRGSFPGGN